MYSKRKFLFHVFLLNIAWLTTLTSCHRNKSYTLNKSSYDSIEYNRLLQEAVAFRSQYKLDSAYSALLRLHDWALRSNDSILIARSLIELGNVNKSDVKVFIAEKHLDEAIAILRRHHQPALLAEALENAGLAKQLEADYQASHKLWFESLEIAEFYKNNKQICRLLNLIGSNLDITGNKSQAVVYFHRALHLADKYHFEQEKYFSYTNLGLVYRLQNPDSAKYYYEKVINAPLLPDGTLTRLQAEFNLGNVYFDQKDYDKALSAYQHVHQVSLHEKIPEGIIVSMSGIAGIYSKQNKVAEAIKLLNEAILYFEKTGNTDIVVRLKQNIIECYRKEGNYKEIDRLYSNIMHLRDSLMDANRQANIQNLEFFYQNKKKELQNKQLAAELRLAKLSSAFWLVIFLMVSCCSIGMLAYYQKNLKQKHQSLKDLEEQIHMEEERNNSKTQHAKDLEKKMAEKQKELSSLSYQLRSLKYEMTLSNGNATAKDIESLVNTSTNSNGKNYWENLTIKFNIIYPGFTDKLTSSYPNLNTNDIQFCLLMKLNLPLKDIANILNISQHSLYKRKYRLAEKMKLDGKDKDLYSVIQNLQ